MTFSLSGALTYTGTITGEGTVNDILSLATGADISGGTITNVEDLTLASGASVTMTAAQNNAFTGTITAAGTETIILSDTASATALGNVENYTLASGGTITVLAATNVTGAAGNETVNVGGLTVTGTYALSTGTDVISATTGANISGVNSGSATTAESLTLASGASICPAARSSSSLSGV